MVDEVHETQSEKEVYGFVASTTSIVLGLRVSSPVLLGDVDFSGTVDFADIPAFIAVLLSDDFQPEADCDQSGAVDFSDIPAFIAILLGS